MPRPTATARRNRELGIYRRVYVQVHNDARFRALSAPAPSAQYLWLRLLTSPESVAAPGVIATTRAGLAEKLGWKLKDFNRCFDELTVETDEHDYPLAMADWTAGLVFLPKAVEYNPPVSPNVVKAWVASLLRVPECDLRNHVIKRLEQFLSPYSEQFHQPFVEQFRESGAGAGAGVTTPTPSIREKPTPAAALDGTPASPEGSAAGAPSAQPGETPDGSESGGDGGKPGGEFSLDSGGVSEPVSAGTVAKQIVDSMGSGTGRPATASADGDGWELESRTVPADGKDPVGGGCTMCFGRSKSSRVTPRAPGLLFRRIKGLWFAAMCWGCDTTGKSNAYDLPIPPKAHQGTSYWKCFEHALPEHVRAAAGKREKLIAAAIKRTRDRMEVADQRQADQSHQRSNEPVRRDVPDCRGCDTSPGKPGLVYRTDSIGVWIAALCAVCGGSRLQRDTPKFMGPPLPMAVPTAGWLKIGETDAPKPSSDSGAAMAELFKWQDAAITGTRNRLKASGTRIDGTREAPKIAPSEGDKVAPCGVCARAGFPSPHIAPACPTPAEPSQEEPAPEPEQAEPEVNADPTPGTPKGAPAEVDAPAADEPESEPAAAQEDPSPDEFALGDDPPETGLEAPAAATDEFSLNDDIPL